MRYQCVIWDFNGTIADDLALSIDAINTVLMKRNLPCVKNVESYQKVFGFPIREYYKRLGFDFNTEPYEIPAKEWVDVYLTNLQKITVVEGVRQVLKEIQSAGIMQIILSASEKNMLCNMLQYLKLESYFQRILCAEDIYGNGKISVAKKFAEETDIPLFSTLLIGDTSHDAATAIALGCDCILYSGGHMSKDKLLTCGFPVIDKMSEVLHTVFS